jgi:hypothetical protein
MTDQEIERAVALARGWTPIPMGAAGEGWERPSGGIGALPRVCSDPAAWGALLSELGMAGYDIELLILPGIPASVRIRRPGALQSGYGTDAEIGRAIARAFLGARGELR